MLVATSVHLRVQTVQRYLSLAEVRKSIQARPIIIRAEHSRQWKVDEARQDWALITLFSNLSEISTTGFLRCSVFSMDPVGMDFHQGSEMNLNYSKYATNKNSLISFIIRSEMSDSTASVK